MCSELAGMLPECTYGPEDEQQQVMDRILYPERGMGRKTLWTSNSLWKERPDQLPKPTYITFLDMEVLLYYLNHWKGLQLFDLFGLSVSVLNVLVNLGSIMLFRKFVRSKPTGRKTVLGNTCTLNRYNYFIFLHKSILN